MMTHKDFNTKTYETQQLKNILRSLEPLVSSQERELKALKHDIKRKLAAKQREIDETALVINVLTQRLTELEGNIAANDKGPGKLLVVNM